MTVKGEYIRRTLLDESNRWLKNQNTVLASWALRISVVSEKRLMTSSDRVV
ncbi:hypothetical protein [Alistipes onderdonkii]|uniref:hypothetical protein n=1 Tax=Alistipes onderdonkii TaxID=328813 RepID=UPI0032EC2758